MNDQITGESDCCCSAEPKKAGGKLVAGQAGKRDPAFMAKWGGAIFSFLLLVAGMLTDYFWQPTVFTGWIRVAWYVIAYLPEGCPVLAKAVRLIVTGEESKDFFIIDSGRAQAWTAV